MCNNTLPEFKLEDNLKLINVVHVKKRERLMITHDTLNILVMRNPFKCFCRIFSYVESAKDVLHWDICLLAPFLDCRELHINVMRMGNVGTATINQSRLRYWNSNATCFMMDVKVSIEDFIPVRPNVEVLEPMMHKVFEKMLFISHC